MKKLRNLYFLLIWISFDLNGQIGILVANDSFVRAIDAFVDAIELKSSGFYNVDCGEEGRLRFHPSTLLKLYL
jgi:hypothetical protein